MCEAFLRISRTTGGSQYITHHNTELEFPWKNSMMKYISRQWSEDRSFPLPRFLLGALLPSLPRSPRKEKRQSETDGVSRGGWKCWWHHSYPVDTDTPESSHQTLRRLEEEERGRAVVQRNARYLVSVVNRGVTSRPTNSPLQLYRHPTEDSFLLLPSAPLFQQTSCTDGYWPTTTLTLS